MVAAACGHPSTGNVTTGGGGGSNGSGGSGNGSGSGNGGSTGSGSGGAGGGETVNPDGGSGQVTKKACTADPNQQHALPYTDGQIVASGDQSLATAAVSNLTTLTSKVDQLHGPNPGTETTDIFRTADTGGLRGFQFRDGPRGVNLDAVKPAGAPGYSTAFPVASLRGATFDVDLENQVGLAMGDELIAAGGTMILAPTVNILRHPAWGRAEETYGEDSFLLGRLGSAYVMGVQKFAPACVKHFAANNIELNRGTAVAAMDDQTLHEVYARHFGMIIKDGGVSCVMAAYNLIQLPGQQAFNCTQNKHLLHDILRTEFGFQGMVLSDWWAMPGGRSVTSSASTYARDAINAGLEMELPDYINFTTLPSQTDLTAQITQAVTDVTLTKYRFKVATTGGSIGLMTPTTTFNSGSYSMTNTTAHESLAEKIAEEGMVLLQNTNSVLPIKTDGSVKTVAVIGPVVNWSLAIGGTGSINMPTQANIGDRGSSRVNMDPAKAIGPLAGIMAAKPSSINIVSGNQASMAAGADLTVVVVGLTPEDEGEEYTLVPEDPDRDQSLALDGKHGGTTQNNFIKAAVTAAAGKPVVVVLEGGSAIDVSSWRSMVSGIVMAWYPGQAGGTALGKLLFGQVNFSGKLPITWPHALADEPTFSTPPVTQMGYYLGYRWFDTQGKTPEWQFGYGLAYTKYTYSNLGVPCTTVPAGGTVNVTVDVKNTGTVAGTETALLFVSYPGTAVPNRGATNYKELKGFRRVTLNPGESKNITIPIRVSDLQYFDTASQTWKVESGTVKVMVGGSAATADLTNTDTFTVQ